MWFGDRGEVPVRASRRIRHSATKGSAGTSRFPRQRAGALPPKIGAARERRDRRSIRPDASTSNASALSGNQGSQQTFVLTFVAKEGNVSMLWMASSSHFAIYTIVSRRFFVALKKVTMSLSEWDVQNTATLVERLHSRNRAAAVSSALAITEGLTRRIEQGEELVLRKKNGTLEKVMIAGM